jgi:hypothetical protein
MLSEAREYRLGCWLATQYLSNLESKKMREAVLNNCRTKIIFKPSDSDNQNRLLNSLNQISKDDINQLGRFRGVLQTPDEQQQTPAVIFDTYPPWNTENPERVDKLKQEQSVAKHQSQKGDVELEQSLGQGNNAGGKAHEQLLVTAKKHLEEERSGVQVNLLYQGQGDDKPDGKVILPDGEIAHLEAEHSTLSKPGKVLTNLKRAQNEDRECIFVVEQGNAAKLDNILSDPVNRRGNQHEDSKGSYSYYSTEDGEITDADELEDADYRIIEIQENQLEIHNEPVEPECPELDNHPEEELEQFCLYREDDGYCTALGQTCVITQEE